MDHVHYDMTEAERTIRASFVGMNDMPRPSSMKKRDHQFVDAQIDCQETQVQFALWQLRQVNKGVDIELLIQAAGAAIGSMLWSFADNTEFEPTDVLNAILEKAAETIAHHIDGNSTASVQVGKTSINGDMGGRA
jgi:hypothetical protein